MLLQKCGFIVAYVIPKYRAGIIDNSTKHRDVSSCFFVAPSSLPLPIILVLIYVTTYRMMNTKMAKTNNIKAPCNLLWTYYYI